MKHTGAVHTCAASAATAVESSAAACLRAHAERQACLLFSRNLLDRVHAHQATRKG